MRTSVSEQQQFVSYQESEPLKSKNSQSYYLLLSSVLSTLNSLSASDRYLGRLGRYTGASIITWLLALRDYRQLLQTSAFASPTTAQTKNRPTNHFSHVHTHTLPKVKM